MAQTRHQQTLADYVTIAISPILIMAMVGSLVYFLLEVLYTGKYEFRLQWILFCFVFGIVLVARMSMRDDLSAPWSSYGLVLGLVVWIAICRFVQFDPDTPLAPFSWAINAALMGVVWWSAHKLTWDCTYIDDQVDASGVGLMQAAGIEDANPKSEIRNPKSEVRNPKSTDRKKAKKEPSDPSSTPDPAFSDFGFRVSDFESRSSILNPPSSTLTWWERWQKHRAEQRKKPHNPGVWVIYFSLAALPLFGLGQSLIPAGDEGRRRYVFWLMIVYLGSGLGLLLTTSFLGLRRYLRQRKVPMPKTIAGAWLATGGLLIVALLIGGAILPRPNAEYPLVDVGKLVGSKNREASRFAFKGDSPGKGQGKAATDRPPDNEKGSPGSGNKPDKQGGKQSQGQSGQQKGDQSGQKSNSKGDKKGESSSSDQKSGGEQKGKSDRQKEKKDKGKEGQGSDSDDQDTSTKPPTSFHTSLGSGLATVLKWVVFTVLALAVAYYLFRNGLKYLGNFTQWARRLLAALDAFWQRLLGWFTPRADRAETPGETESIPAPPRPFSSFANPFRTGAASQYSPEELVRYSFEALEAWGRERDLERYAEETPLEYGRRVSEATPGLEIEANQLAGLYVRAAYGRARLSDSSLPTLQKFWDRLESVSEAPLSA
jgi:hypothetical protein